ncbi:S8 family peptidase [Saccharothrix australiensis]|uniref:Subtilase family protein n=1 Tax=Saccharothrix australiensis TaxID=2072 RepID=A0A495W9X8_9PSEU|nr:S8/S53 family peptidase [Saccharothrix australiensis]RKT57964.1 subtilase family protein [Saccharothrix australiensis]
MVSDVDLVDVVSLAEIAERCRAEQPDLTVHDPGGPQECLLRSGELLVRSDGVPMAVDRLRRWVDRVEDAADLVFARIRLRPGEEPVRIAADSGLAVAPNHVHVGSPIMIGTARPLPRSAPPPPAPAEETWDVTAAVLDTGLDPHPWFAGREWFAASEHSPEVLDADGRPGQDRQAGHGTFVTGVLLTHAPGVRVRHRRVLSSLGLTDDATVAAGLRAVRGTVDVIVLTAGCHTADDTCPPVLRHEVERSGATVVAAAGNGATTRPVWPAALPTVVAVGADAPFSNHGPWVDAIAPAVDVTSSFVRLAPSADAVPGTETREYGYARWSGTSFAAPRVAADIARLLHLGVPPAEAVRQVTALQPT